MEGYIYILWLIYTHTGSIFTHCECAYVLLSVHTYNGYICRYTPTRRKIRHVGRLDPFRMLCALWRLAKIPAPATPLCKHQPAWPVACSLGACSGTALAQTRRKEWSSAVCVPRCGIFLVVDEAPLHSRVSNTQKRFHPSLLPATSTRLSR